MTQITDLSVKILRGNFYDTNRRFGHKNLYQRGLE